DGARGGKGGEGDASLKRVHARLTTRYGEGRVRGGAVGWAKSLTIRSTRGHGAGAILPTRISRAARLCPPYEALHSRPRGPTQNNSALLKDLRLAWRHSPQCEATAAPSPRARWPRRADYPSLDIPFASTGQLMAPAQIKRRAFISLLGWRSVGAARSRPRAGTRAADRSAHAGHGG